MENRYEKFTVLIAKINRNIRKIKNQEIAEYNLKSPHISCLYFLYLSGGLTATELCERCEEDKATISRSLDYLEKEGYLTCEAKNTKRYKSPLVLTEKGKEQEVLFIPSEYDGNKVILKANSLITALVNFDSEKLKKVYISEGMTGCGNLNVVNGYIEIIILSNNIESIPNRGQVFVTSEAFEREISKFIMPANVSYNWNYEGAPNSGI